MRLMGVDPSSTAIGYAVITGLERTELLTAGVLLPEKGDDKRCLESCRAGFHALMDAAELAHWRRAWALVDELGRLIGALRPDVVAVEIPSGRIGTGAKRGARGALTTYAVAAGMAYQECTFRAWCLPVTERMWTAGRGDKATRAAVIKGVYGDRYLQEEDTGLDVADAIGIARWVIEQQTELKDLACDG